jgi:hypothetical protein
MPTRKNCRERREQRKVDAESRQGDRQARGDAGQLMHLESQGFGDCKEARRLREKVSLGEPGVPNEPLDKE